MKNRIATIYVLIAFTLCAVQVHAQVPSIRDDPNWMENDINHPHNDQNAYLNSEWHPNNNRYRTNADNIIRGEDGKPMGYSVEKENGGTNYFLYDDGGRFGYSVGGDNDFKGDHE